MTPKSCSCGATYSLSQFLALDTPVRGGVQYDEVGEPALLLRNCACNSTLCIEVPGYVEPAGGGGMRNLGPYCAACQGIGAVSVDAGPYETSRECDDCCGSGYASFNCDNCNRNETMESASGCANPDHKELICERCTRDGCGCWAEIATLELGCAFAESF